ncbi:MAG TPA: hypothetical protein PLI06_05600 [Methanofastidiosum sp.]|nr:hypothetical protein [Methanofastidiosum sp.]
MDALSIVYSGESDAAIWIENSILTLSLDTETEFDITGSSLEDLALALNLVEGITAVLIADGDIQASDLNEISSEYSADIKSRPYFLGHGNYSNPKKVSEVSHKNAEEIRNSWLDEADALIESLTGLNFRARSLEGVSIDIRARDIFSNEDYGDYRRANGLYFRQFAPITSIEALAIDGVSVTPSKAIVDYDRIILSSSAEVSSWQIGKSKATVSLTYGYAKGSRESVLASEFATLYTCNMLFESDLRLRQKAGATKITHASVVFENDTIPEEAISRKEIELRMKLILEHLPKKMRSVLG